MGRKQRRSRSIDDADDDDLDDSKDNHDNQDNVVGSTDATGVDTSAISASMKDIDFIQRREIQRKQSADKRRNKMKCYLCGRAGHVRRECPGIQDDGRGMSRYKGKSNTKHEIQKFNQGKKKGDNDYGNNGPHLDYPLEVSRRDSVDEDEGGENDSGNANVAYYYDISCDVQATMEYCKAGRGKAKISQREAFQEYQEAIEDANTHTYFGGMISKSILKQNRPWVPPDEDWTPIANKTWYMVGLSREYSSNADDDVVEFKANAAAILVETLRSNPTKVVGYWAVLDFTADYCKRGGCDRESQRRRVQATFEAAGETNVPVQIQILPGAAGLELDGTNSAGSDYAQVLMELTSLMTEITTHYPNICVILSNWTGLACHMISLLKAFGGTGDPSSNPSTGKFYIALDGAVSFAKAVHLHECAFEIPLDRLLIETATVIPSDIANALGRDAFFHSGLWPFVAQAVAQYKKTASLETIVQATSSLTLALYPQLIVVENEGLDSSSTM